MEAVLTLKPASDPGRSSLASILTFKLKTVFEETIVKPVLPRERMCSDHWLLERNLLNLASSTLIGTISLSSFCTQAHE